MKGPPVHKVLTGSNVQPFNMSRRPYARPLGLQGINPGVRKLKGKDSIFSAAVTRIKQAEANGKIVTPEPMLNCSVGDVQLFGQPPSNYLRNVLALVKIPHVLYDSGKREALEKLFPVDVIKRAEVIHDEIVAECGSTGSYSDCIGYRFVRKQVARTLNKRDGTRNSDPNHIVLLDGASGVPLVMNTLVRHPYDAFLLPVPNYPLYTAAVDVMHACHIPYYLDPNNRWEPTEETLQDALGRAVEAGACPRAIVVVNPSNPTGTVLSRETMRSILRLCYDHSMVLIAVEVYQGCVYPPAEWVSFRKVLSEMGGEIASKVVVFSMHSASKGYVGEGGRRGGYVELLNLNAEVLGHVRKLAALNLCPNVEGQLVMHQLCSPPQPSETSIYDEYTAEYAAVQTGMQAKAKRMVEVLNSVPGMSCDPIDGSLYAFPKLEMPEAFETRAEEMGVPADVLWVTRLLEETGVYLNPGSTYGVSKGKSEDTYRVRSTLCLADDDIDRVGRDVTAFQEGLWKQYGGTNTA